MMKYIITIILFFSISAISFADEASSYENNEITARAHIIGWRLKAVDGKIFKRLYNYSTEKWVGNWIRA